MKKLLLVTVLVIAQHGAYADFVGTQCWIDGKLAPVRPGDQCPGTSTSNQGGVVGPPIIIWRHPSAEGSHMLEMSPVGSNLNSRLNAIADTSITLMQKGRFAMRNGDLAAAKRYFDQANQLDPQNPEILRDMAALQNLFDNGTQKLAVPHLQLQQEILKLTPMDSVKKYEGNPEVKALRQAELQAYKELAEANANFDDMTDKAKAGTGNQSDVNSAQTKLDAAAEKFKQAQTKLKNKIYVLDNN